MKIEMTYEQFKKQEKALFKYLNKIENKYELIINNIPDELINKTSFKIRAKLDRIIAVV